MAARTTSWISVRMDHRDRSRYRFISHKVVIHRVAHTAPTIQSSMPIRRQTAIQSEPNLIHETMATRAKALNASLNRRPTRSAVRLRRTNRYFPPRLHATIRGGRRCPSDHVGLAGADA